MREPAVPRIGRRAERRSFLRVVQRIIHARQHTGGIPKARMLGNVFDALTIDPDLPVIPQAVKELLAGQGSLSAPAVGLRPRVGGLCLLAHRLSSKRTCYGLLLSIGRTIFRQVRARRSETAALTTYGRNCNALGTSRIG